MQTIPADEVASRAISGAMQAQLQAVPAVDPTWHSARKDGEAGGRTQIFHLYFEGQQRMVDSPWAAVQEAQRMGAFES